MIGSTRENPITEVGPERKYRFCKCWQCGLVARCTPAFDFYGGDCGPLTCETCMRADPLCLKRVVESPAR